MDMTAGDTQLIIRTCREKNLLRNQIAYILATANWETARTMKPVREAFWMSEQWRADKLRYYPWYGRGYVQLTWERNYRRAENELGVDLTSNPDAAMKPEIAAKVLVMGMMFGWFTGAALPVYVNDTKSDYINARRVVNGTDKAEEIAELARKYEEELIANPAKQPAKPNPIAALLRSISGGK